MRPADDRILDFGLVPACNESIFILSVTEQGFPIRKNPSWRSEVFKYIRPDAGVFITHYLKKSNWYKITTVSGEYDSFGWINLKEFKFESRLSKQQSECVGLSHTRLRDYGDSALN